MRNAIVSALCVAFLLGTTCAWAQQTLQRPSERYRLQNGDVVDVVLPYSPEFNQTVTVQPDGYITLRVLGDVQSAGLTVPELSEMLRQKYSAILREPIVTIELKDFEKPYFIAGGEVSKPGKYEMRGEITLTEAIATAGGFSQDAKHSQVLLFRRSSDEWVEVKTVNMKKVLKGDRLNDDYRLQPGDMLYVPEKFMAKIKPFMPIAAIRLFFQPF